jgi:electron transfer flavoprotein alpha subunit
MALVLVEQTHDGALVDVSGEALTFARGLAADGAVDAVVIGQPTPALQQDLASYGVRNVHALTGDAFGSYAGAAWAAGLDSVLSATGSAVVIAAGSPRGNEVLAHLAARRRVAMAANVVSCDGAEPLTVTRQVVGGAALEDMRLTDRPAIFTVAGHALEASPAAAPGPATILVEQPAVAAEDLLARVVAVSDPEPDLSGSLKSARVVVGAGRGAGSA